MRAAHRLSRPVLSCLYKPSSLTLRVTPALLRHGGQHGSLGPKPRTACVCQLARPAATAAEPQPSTQVASKKRRQSLADHERPEGVGALDLAAKRTSSRVKPLPLGDRSNSSGHTVSSSGSSSSSRQAQLAELQALLGYQFRDIGLLDQACTHDPSGSCPSYRELAFVGDAALWLLFAEHAFRCYEQCEDPISGGWPALLSELLSRSSCAATARQWGLGAYLQHSTRSHAWPSQKQQQSQLQQQQQQHQKPLGWNECSSTSDISLSSLSRSESLDSSSSSSSSRSGMHGGVWTSDTLAEMFEGLVGAVLLDCGAQHAVLKQLMLPWVAASFDAAKQAAAAAETAAATTGVTQAQPCAVVPAVGSTLHQAAMVLEGDAARQQQQLVALQQALQQQLLATCGLHFSCHQVLDAASRHMLRLLTSGACCAEAESQKFLGFGILQFAAALQAYCLRHQNWQKKIWRETAAAPSTQWPPQLQQQVAAVEAAWLCKSSSGGGGGSDVSSSSDPAARSKLVQQMAKHASELTTVRHRAKMWLQLLGDTSWCPQHSHLTASAWKQQKHTLARCLDLLLAAVYLDAGLEAALGVAGLLVRSTPPTTHLKDWMPEWTRQSSSGGGGGGGGSA